MIGFNLNKTKRHFTEVLATRYTSREAEQLMRILLEDLFGIDRKRQLMEPDLRIDEAQYALLDADVKRLLKGEPVQYVTGVAHFDDLLIKVSPSVLIPRPETEDLVRLVADSLPVDRPVRIWDFGTGSGCIAIALAKRFPLAEVKAFDFSESALEQAAENAERNGVMVEFICDDLLCPHSSVLEEPVDLVVSNPPYVRESEKAEMERNVLDYEPSSALFVPDEDPLVFYRQILKLALPQIKPHGSVWFEINEAMGLEMLLLALEMGANAELKNDFANKPRILKATLKS